MTSGLYFFVCILVLFYVILYFMKVRTVFRHLFIPHHGNDYKPHFFREVAVSLILFISVFMLGSSFGSSFFIHRTVLGAEIASGVLIDLTNESRVAEHELPLLKNDKLTKAAQLKGEDMVAKEYFAHNSPDGVTPWHWFKEAGYTFLYAGENLAINFTDSSDVEKAWLNSPKHRANIMNAEFREIGIATVPGTYENVPTIYIVQMFGTPAYAEITPEVKTTVTVKKSQKAVDVATTTTILGAEGILAGNVKGDSSQKEASLLNVNVAGDMVVAKNNNAIMPPEYVTSPIERYSTWYEKILFNGSRYVDVIYKVLTLLVAFALVTMIVIEIRKQHIRHIFYGASLLVLLQLFMYINQSFF